LWYQIHLHKSGRWNHILNWQKKYDYKVFAIVVENRHGGVNVHSVPEEVLESMRNRFSIKL
jgi:hypothetical protein